MHSPFTKALPSIKVPYQVGTVFPLLQHWTPATCSFHISSKSLYFSISPWLSWKPDRLHGKRKSCQGPKTQLLLPRPAPNLTWLPGRYHPNRLWMPCSLFILQSFPFHWIDLLLNFKAHYISHNVKWKINGHSISVNKLYTNKHKNWKWMVKK